MMLIPFLFRPNIVSHVKPWVTRTFSSEVYKKTSLHNFHVENGGKMVPFAGYSMPVQYLESIKDSHLHTRSSCSLFDVSHMLQTMMQGPESIQVLEHITVADVKGLKEGSSTLSLFTNEKGGIEDDLIITRIGSDSFYIVSNAGCAQKDKGIMEAAAAGKKITINYLDQSHSLIALQGPKAKDVLKDGLDYDLNQQKFMTSRMTNLFGSEGVRVTRCGYTGEDGFEVSVPNSIINQVTEQLLKNPDCWLAGLGARDSLRLEAGLCLYGSDIDQDTTPVEAGLVWTIGKRRREEGGGFPGDSIILNQIKNKPERKRVGLKSIGKSGPPARHGADIQVESQGKVGQVTSGIPSPSMNVSIAMGYVTTKSSKLGTKVQCLTRGKTVEYEVVKMPFIPSNYFV